MIKLTGMQKSALKAAKTYLKNNDVYSAVVFLRDSLMDRSDYTAIINYILEQGIDLLPYFKETIPMEAFYGTNIKEAIIREPVFAVGRLAFCECKNLSRVVFPDTLKKIYGHAFYGCTSLKRVTLPEGLMIIDYKAFANCTGLRNIILSSTVDAIAETAFDGCTKDLRIHCPFDPAYINWPGWERYKDQIVRI